MLHTATTKVKKPKETYNLTELPPPILVLHAAVQILKPIDAKMLHLNPAIL